MSEMLPGTTDVGDAVQNSSIPSTCPKNSCTDIHFNVQTLNCFVKDVYTIDLTITIHGRSFDESYSYNIEGDSCQRGLGTALLSGSLKM